MTKCNETTEILKGLRPRHQGEVLKFLKISERNRRSKDVTDELLRSLAIRLSARQRAN